MVFPQKAADPQKKNSVISSITNVLSGNKHQSPKSQDPQEVDLDQLDMVTLRNLLAENQDNEDVLLHFARRALREGAVKDVLTAVTLNPEAILNQCPEVAAQYLVIHRGTREVFSAEQLFRLGQWCESAGKTSYALSIYEQWELAYFDLPELEAVSYRAASLWWRGMANPKRALQKLEIIHRKFRNGQYARQAGELRNEILGANQGKAA